MNNILELKGKSFGQSRRPGGGGGASMNGSRTVDVDHLNKLLRNVVTAIEFWRSERKPFSGVFITAHYNKIAAKSNRISGMLKKSSSSEYIVGAKFDDDRSKHIITYYIDFNDLTSTVESIKKTINILIDHFDETIDQDKFIKGKIDKVMYNKYDISKSLFKAVIADASYLEKFTVETCDLVTERSIVTLYNTELDVITLLSKIGITLQSSRVLENQTVFLDENELSILYNKASYLVSMATVDVSKMVPEKSSVIKDEFLVRIPPPTNEPTIGVIDTLFDDNVYFSDWVEYHELVDSNLPRGGNDYKHGTAVSSLIVDGHRLNNWLDDGCGRFKVRHFGVALASNFSSFTIIKHIKNIINENKDIRVWNISLGSDKEVNDNFISAEAAVLDQIQFENDVIFVIAGTNKPSTSVKKIGAPADSVNGIVVNSVTCNNEIPNYSREGFVLSFHSKPDVSYYGGSKERFINVCEPLGRALVSGTSYAAPLIARKLSYLIDIIGLKRELAKALIIDSARGWIEQLEPSQEKLLGHGIVPININEILQSSDDEIKFLVYDVNEKWNTHSYEFPIPLHNDKYPYVAKVTMCYFPKCDRLQGVDYTNTEFNVKFGRLNNNGKIVDIKGDKQNQCEPGAFIYESVARKEYRKWDNVKYKAEVLKDGKRPKMCYGKKEWGIEVKTSNRVDNKDGIGVKFGIVVTLKEIYGKNRIDEFVRNCTLKGWLVNEINLESKIDIYTKLSEEIILD